jgi:nucleoside-diphosphate-sugar epimerase
LTIEPKVLVTGANGYGGGGLCRYLAERGVEVRGMYYTPDGGEPDFSHPNLELVPGDLTDGESLEKALDGIEVVHNLAALYRPANVSMEMYFKVNVDGVKDLVERAARHKVRRFVHCSTMGIHGTVSDPPGNEESPIQPDDYYQESKYRGEVVAMGRARELGLEIASIRPTAIYGPRERRFLKLARMISSGKSIMFGSGEIHYHFIHTNDLSQAFVLAAEKPQAVGEVYLIGDEHPTTLNEIYQIIGDELGQQAPRYRLPYRPVYAAAALCEFVFLPLRPLGVSPPLYRRRVHWFDSERWFDISKAKRDLGFQPQVKLEDGLVDMIRSFVAAGWLKASSRPARGARARKA